MFHHGVMSSMSWHPISCPYHLIFISYLISDLLYSLTWYTILPSSEWKPIYQELRRYDEILLFRPCNRTSGCWCNSPSSSTLRMASKILAEMTRVRKSRRFSWVTTALTAKKKPQVCSSTVYKMQDTLYAASISFWLKSRYSRLISGVMTITPLFSLWCRISWWSKPYCSQGSESASMMALTSPNIERQETQARGSEVNCWRQLQQMPQSSSDQNVSVHVEDPVTLTS